MKPLALGVFEDLRRRRLLPVAILLLIALVAVPVLMLKKADPVPVGTPFPLSRRAPRTACRAPRRRWRETSPWSASQC